MNNINLNLGLNEIELEFYLRDFRKMAQRGFYSYDKTYIDEFENRFFHLVAYPKISKSASNEKKIYDKFIQDLFKSKELLRVRKLPINFEPFDL